MTSTRTNAFVQQHCEPPPPDRSLASTRRRYAPGSENVTRGLGVSRAILGDLKLLVIKADGGRTLVEIPREFDEGRWTVVGGPDHQRERFLHGGGQWSGGGATWSPVLGAVFCESDDRWRIAAGGSAQRVEEPVTVQVTGDRLGFTTEGEGPHHLVVSKVTGHSHREDPALALRKEVRGLSLVRLSWPDPILGPDGHVNGLFRVAVEVAPRQTDRPIGIGIPTFVHGGDRLPVGTDWRKRKLSGVELGPARHDDQKNRTGALEKTLSHRDSSTMFV